MFTLLVATAQADHLCFSPVKEKQGDKSTKRPFWQSFDYKIQVDNGPLVVPSEEESTKYEITSDNPMVKIYLGNKIIFYKKCFISPKFDAQWLELF